MLDWLLETAAEAPTLYGFDFSAAPPIVERGAYLPGETAPPADARSFWAYVDRLCEDEDLGAASFLEEHHRPHFYFGAADGAKADFLHHRVCEHAFNATGGGKASTLYDAIGAAQVAKASYAGMRLLHRLDGQGAGLAHRLRSGQAHGPAAGQRRRRNLHARLHPPRRPVRAARCAAAPQLDAALSGLGSRPARLRARAERSRDRRADRRRRPARHRGDPRYWNPPQLTPELARTEGWTFGVL